MLGALTHSDTSQWLIEDGGTAQGGGTGESKKENRKLAS